jgi:predicted aspartyl protease
VRRGPRAVRVVGFALLWLAVGSPALADLYRWTDADGAVHYTTDLESIPAERRVTAATIGYPGPQPAPPPGSAAAAATVLPFTGGGPVVIEARLNGVPLRLLLDTGADRTLISPAALARSGIDATAGAPVRLTGVTGTGSGTLVTVPRLDVAGAQIGPLGVIAYAMPEQGQGLDGLLGRDVLDAFVVTFDAPAGRVLLTPR